MKKIIDSIQWLVVDVAKKCYGDTKEYNDESLKLVEEILICEHQRIYGWRVFKQWSYFCIVGVGLLLGLAFLSLLFDFNLVINLCHLAFTLFACFYIQRKFSKANDFLKGALNKKADLGERLIGRINKELGNKSKDKKPDIYLTLAKDFFVDEQKCALFFFAMNSR